MDRLYSYLKSHKTINVLIVLGYYFLVVLPHNIVGAWINGLFEQSSRQTYNTIVMIVTIVLCVTIIAILFSKIKQHPSQKMVVGFLLATMLFCVLCFSFLMVINIEVVHFVQYAILAILIFPLNKNYLGTIIFCSLAGGLDEAYQYLELENNAFYYDFNDVVLDCVGACIGILILFIHRILPAEKGNGPWFKQSHFITLMIVATVLLIKMMLGTFVLVDSIDDPAYFALFRKPPPAGFWFYPSGPYARFHILMPIPALIIIASLCFTYNRLSHR